MTSRRVDEATAIRRDGMPDATDARGPMLRGIVGDQSDKAGESRSGEDARRRGWYWGWNTIVTQFAPLIGLDGVGLLDSYVVWTDRREDSPFRGFAFPSTTSEAAFYGTDRNLLGTINKILVALDLIEIRKSMVHRPDESGNDWKYPHNTYRVKDHGQDFQLNADHVRALIALAEKDTAVYRRIRHIFSTKFKPIDPNNVWNEILAELRESPEWVHFAAIVEEDERRASERSKRGHASRGGDKPARPVKSNRRKADETAESTAIASGNDSDNDTADSAKSHEKSSAAQSSNGSATSAAESSNGSRAGKSEPAAGTSNGPATDVQPISTTNYQFKTTTNEIVVGAEEEREGAKVQGIFGEGDWGGGPDDSRDRELALTLYMEANEKPTTIAARKQLATIAANCADEAQAVGLSGWALVGSAISEAVASGSAYVAPKRIREIIARWGRDGVPVEYSDPGAERDRSAHQPVKPVTSDGDVSHRFVRTGHGDAMAAAQVWEQTLSRCEGALPAGALAELREHGRLSGIEAGEVTLHVPDALAGRLGSGERRTLQTKLGVTVKRPVSLRVVSIGAPEADAAPGPRAEGHGRSRSARGSQRGVVIVPGSGMTGSQLWHAVRHELAASRAVPAVELNAWEQASSVLALEGETFVIGFATRFQRRRAETHRRHIEREMMHYAGFTCTVEFVVTEEWERDDADARSG